MSQKDFEIRFDKARARLNNSLKDLEKAISHKLQQTKNSSKPYLASFEEESITVRNLNDKLNNLQKTLAEIGDENENLVAENKLLLSNLEKLKSQTPSLIKAIESDLVKIEDIIKGGNNG